ncbi:MAG: hypothetical protein JWO05_2687 [Gemmatimonadetes bacterium]|nr:hypothetical protein [Gemmatimonadota bacterium]
MPTRAHAKALVDYLERAESAVNDLFYEATDDGIEALEAILLACCEAVMKKMPVRDHRGSAAPGAAPSSASDDSAATG